MSKALIPHAFPEVDRIDAAVGGGRYTRISARPPVEVRVPWTRTGYARYQAYPLVDWDAGRIRYVIPRMHDGIVQVGWADWSEPLSDQVLEIWLGRPPETGTARDRLRASVHMPEVNNQIVIGRAVLPVERVGAGRGWLQVDKWDARVDGSSNYAPATPKTAALVEDVVYRLVRWHFLSWGGRTDLYRAFDRHRAIRRLRESDAEQRRLGAEIGRLQDRLAQERAYRPALAEVANRPPVQPWDQVVLG